jgi:hypothetical protein
LESQVAVTKTGEGIWRARGRRSCSRTRSPICSSRSWLKSGSQIVVPAQRRDLVRPIGEPSLQRHPHMPAGAGQPLLVGDGGGQGDGQLPRRDPALGAGAAPSGAQGAGEGDPVGVQPGVSRGGVHQGAHGVVQAQVAVGLLADVVGGLRAEHDLRAALVGLELVEDGLHLPALGVEGGEVLSGGGGRIQDGDWLPRGSGPAVAPSSRACRRDRGARGARSDGVSRTPAAPRSPRGLRRGHCGRLMP